VRDLSAGKTADAVGELLTVVKIDPSNYIAWYDLGDIAQQLGEQTLAIHDYQASIHADGNYIPALFNLAIMYTSTQPTTAASLYQKAIALKPADAELHLNYGFLLLSTGSRQGGLQQLARAVELQPSLASRIPASDGGTGK
jgi:Tfp pilus assembly protein PilF